jgi:hypothetical protein
MNDKIWTIVTPTGTDTLTCEICGVSQDGSLLIFNMEQNEQGPQPVPIKGYAPGQWLTFTRSQLRTN